MDYENLIDREKRRRTLLVEKLDETDRRIQVLMAMSRQPDPLDKWLDEQTAVAAPTAESAQNSAVVGVVEVAETPPAARMTRDTPRKISAQWIDLIEHLGLGGKDFAQVQAFMARGGTPMTAGSIRTGLMNYRKDYGLVSSPKPGFYCATQKGMDFVQQRLNKTMSDLT